VARVVGQLRVEDAVDCRMADEEVDDGPGVQAVPFHPDGQRLDTAQTR
jgi:hypothetical protein